MKAPVLQSKLLLAAALFGVLGFVTLAVVRLSAGPFTAAPSPSPATVHTINAVAVLPSIIPLNTPTAVTVTATITDPAVVQGGVNLLRVNGIGIQPTIIAEFQNNGNGTFTAQVNLNPSTTSPIQLEVSAAFQGSLLRVLSSPKSISITGTPNGFTLDPSPLSYGGPVSFNNFDNAYIQGGIIPSGGAEIDATAIPLPTSSLNSYITTVELQGSTNISTSSVTVSGIICTEAFYTDTFGSLIYDNVAAYCPSGSSLDKFYLSYRDGDPNANTYVANFQQFLNGTTLAH
jgi:hypothetical protein